MFGCILQNVAAECEKKFMILRFERNWKHLVGILKKGGGGIISKTHVVKGINDWQVFLFFSFFLI